MTMLPLEQREIRLQPDLARAVASMLKGTDRKRTDPAVLKLYQSDVRGTFAELIQAYANAIASANDESVKKVLARVSG